jgi:cell division protein FtsI/penicillin-binding protein 2/cell division protein FtsW (lipid II flippase)
MLGASLFVAAGLGLVFAAKTYDFPSASERLARGELLNLNAAASPAAIEPFLNTFSDASERRAAAERLFAFLERARPLPNAGALARVRRDLPRFSLARFKPLTVVRTPRDFHIAYLAWTALYFAGFWMVALLWRAARFAGDRALLTALHLLTGVGLILMASLRDPLRDSLELRKFSIGVFCGCLLLLLPLLKVFDYRKLAAWCYVPLFAALSLFGLLLVFGRGPGGTDIKVNLGPFQPVELIKISLILFLAGYFSRKWERLRDLSQARFLPAPLRRLNLPTLGDVLPVFGAVALSLAFFFVLKDLGPALVTFFVFLAMFVVARGRPGLAILAAVAMVSGVAAGYRIGSPHTMVSRIDMWLAPWDNDVRGGNQLAHGLWALATGGLWGSGPGWGDPQMIPAGSTDLVLPAIGEEWGFFGVAAVLMLAAFVVARALRIARRARSDYGFLLGLGLAALLAFEMLLITAGALGALPLSGVVSPFLSSGNTAMLANFFICALLISISAHTGDPPDRDLLARPARGFGRLLAACAVALIALAARYQVFDDRSYLARDARSYEEDGVKRAQRNPRLNSIARAIPRGAILDRNGLPIATSDWSELERHRAEYEALGVALDRACSRIDGRHYPFGAAFAHVVGDLRTGENFHASNSSLVEHDANARLRGYDFAELVPLMRTRHQPGNPALARILARDRNVRLTLDARLQQRAAEILQRGVAASPVGRGALVVMEANSGDVLALASAPAPDPPGVRAVAPPPEALLDRARYGQYPPGSTFKLVTAIAALRADAASAGRAFSCRPLGRRVGATIQGWNRPIYDDIGDHAHGSVRMEQAIAVSCNAYFAQLGVHAVGSKALQETTAMVGMSAGDLDELRRALPFAAYGQGPILTTPFKTARVSAAIAAGGKMPQGRWVLDAGNTRIDAPLEILPAREAQLLARSMRAVVTTGTARRAMAGSPVSIAGKTGTAQVDHGMPHAWFTGFAPYDGASPRLAFAVVVEHGGYGGRSAAPIARQTMEAAQELGLISATSTR